MSPQGPNNNDPFFVVEATKEEGGDVSFTLTLAPAPAPTPTLTLSPTVNRTLTLNPTLTLTQAEAGGGGAEGEWPRIGGSSGYHRMAGRLS